MIIDGHADTISRIMQTGQGLKSNGCHFDLIRAKSAGVGMQMLSLYTDEPEGEPALAAVMEQIEYFNAQLQQCEDVSFQVLDRNDLSGLGSQRIGLMLHVEGGQALAGDINNLHRLNELGVRSLGLTWNHRNMLADGVMEKDDQGLTGFGRIVVKELSSLKMLVDLAHLGRKGFVETIELMDRPPVVSHANSYSVCAHPRNLTDEQLLLVRDKGGLVCVTFVPKFTRADQLAEITDIIKHIIYMADLIGAEHIGFGSDFDGSDMILPDVSFYPVLIEEMKKAGFTSANIERITGGNFKDLLNEILK